MTLVNAGCQVGPLDQILKLPSHEERVGLRALGGHCRGRIVAGGTGAQGA